jgi:hypothetical protein
MAEHRAWTTRQIRTRTATVQMGALASEMVLEIRVSATGAWRINPGNQWLRATDFSYVQGYFHGKRYHAPNA